MISEALQDLLDKIEADTWAEENPYEPTETVPTESVAYNDQLSKTQETIAKAEATAPERTITALSGGGDSMVLLDILHETLGAKCPPALFCDTGMEHPETRPFVEKVAQSYEVELYIASPTRSPLEQFTKKGWPFLGKLPARKWMREHKGRDYGFRVNVTACCQGMKIAPARRLIKRAGFKLNYSGTRGRADDSLRSMRAVKDGTLYRNREYKLWQCNPLIGWTDNQINTYTRDRALPRHPLKAVGLTSTGCMYCGGGCQHTNSTYRVLRHTNLEAWHRFMVEWQAGEILLAIKYDRPLWLVRKAIEELGGLWKLAESRPELFDFCRTKPRKGYVK